MCGFSGYLSSGTLSPSAPDILETMGLAIRHRGPDDIGYWLDGEAGFAVVHRRLSIIDLSQAGHQPMLSASGRFVLAYNGEIYNHQALLTELGQNHPTATALRGHSDTETLLACIEAWGIEPTLRKAVGMFAIALWDRQERKLILARDRFGEKPLYYGRCKGQMLFGSELETLRAHPDFDAPISRHSLALYMRYSYVPAPHSIFEGVWKLPAGSLLEIDGAALKQPELPAPTLYWSAADVARTARSNPFQGSDGEALDTLSGHLKQAVKLQQLADVPLGAFLSGGVDSSLIVALMQENSSRAINTFTIGFGENAFNEAGHAKVVAQHLGTDHTELYVSGVQALDAIARIGDVHDEPFADASQVPTYLLCELAKKSVTVALSGDAADELFGGYNRHVMISPLWARLAAIPQGPRALFAKALHCVSAKTIDSLHGLARPLLPQRWRVSQPADRIQQLLELMSAPDKDGVYERIISHGREGDALVIGAKPIVGLSANAALPSSSMDFESWMMFVDARTYLPDDVLVKLDRAAMSVSLETRVPMLDHRLVEFAWSLPIDVKIRNGQGKWPLRQILGRYLPERLIDRPKQGFGLPLANWLRGPLKDWAEGLLSERRLQAQGYLDAGSVRQKWQEHLSGRRNWQDLIWNILMFQIWLERFELS